MPQSPVDYLFSGLPDEDGRFEPPDNSGPYGEFSDEQAQYERELANVQGTFLVFYSENGGRWVSITKNLFDAKEAKRFQDGSTVRRLNDDYSAHEFTEGDYAQEEGYAFLTGTGFWDEEQHPIVRI